MGHASACPTERSSPPPASTQGLRNGSATGECACRSPRELHCRRPARCPACSPRRSPIDPGASRRAALRVDPVLVVRSPESAPGRGSVTSRMTLSDRGPWYANEYYSYGSERHFGFGSGKRLEREPQAGFRLIFDAQRQGARRSFFDPQPELDRCRPFAATELRICGQRLPSAR